MKIQSLAIIFIIIIMPITMVLSEYVNNKVTTGITELEYDTRLLNSTYDAIKAYQLNTINNSFSDVTNSKIEDIEAAATTFYNSLATNFNYTGYKSSIMKDYVPAVVFTMYDGYYIYSPFINTLTEVADDDYDESYSKDKEIMSGLKPYVYYTCRYNIDDNNDFNITYTLDNYITIQGIVKGTYVYRYGYLYSIADSKSDANDGKGIYKQDDDTYIYDGVTFNRLDTEELKEHIGNKEYSYVKINGRKYYLEEGNTGSKDANGIDEGSKIFYIDDSGEKNYNQISNKTYGELNSSYGDLADLFRKYYLAIKNNKSSYEYYKNAYEFSQFVKDKLGDLKYANLIIDNDNGTSEIKTESNKNTKIFNFDSDVNIEYANSSFNQHRKAVIRYVIETNLVTAISGFSSNAKASFIMPKISETDWDIIENDVCAISFLQGLNIGAKKYNGYSVVANALTKEYIDENDIYILAYDDTYGTYCTANDSGLTDGSLKIKSKDSPSGYYSGIWKVNFEQKKEVTTSGTDYYIPMKYKSGSNLESYLGSYTSIMGNSGLKATSLGTEEYVDMYTYMHNKGIPDLKKAYYTALGRERWGAFNINNVNFELNGGNDYFLDDY